MWFDILLELIGAGIEAMFNSGGWKARRQRRKENKAKRRGQGTDSGLVQNHDS